MTKEKILNSPDEFFQIADNNEAKALLFELGIIDKFAKNQGGTGKATVQAITGDLRTHYVLAMFCEGNPLESDNGYVVFCIPRTQRSPAEMNEMMPLLFRIFEGKGMALQNSKQLRPFSSEN